MRPAGRSIRGSTIKQKKHRKKTIEKKWNHHNRRDQKVAAVSEVISQREFIASYAKLAGVQTPSLFVMVSMLCSAALSSGENNLTATSIKQQLVTKLCVFATCVSDVWTRCFVGCVFQVLWFDCWKWIICFHGIESTAIKHLTIILHQLHSSSVFHSGIVINRN